MTYRTLIESTLAHALTYIESLDEAPVSATTSLAHLRKRLGRPLADEGMDATLVINELVVDVQGGIFRYFGGTVLWLGSRWLNACRSRCRLVYIYMGPIRRFVRFRTSHSRH